MNRVGVGRGAQDQGERCTGHARPTSEDALPSATQRAMTMAAIGLAFGS